MTEKHMSNLVKMTCLGACMGLAVALALALTVV